MTSCVLMGGWYGFGQMNCVPLQGKPRWKVKVLTWEKDSFNNILQVVGVFIGRGREFSFKTEDNQENLCLDGLTQNLSQILPVAAASTRVNSAMPLFRWLVWPAWLPRPGFPAAALHSGFVVDEMSMEQFVLRVLRSPRQSVKQCCVFIDQTYGGWTAGSRPWLYGDILSLHHNNKKKW
jgi:hypothetical protein